MTIKVYAAMVGDDPLESHEWEGTFAEWLDSKGVDWESADVPLVVVTVNGDELRCSDWEAVTLKNSDIVQVRRVQHGGVFSGISNIVGQLFNTVFGWLMPGGGSGRDNYRAAAQGKQLSAAEGKANTAKLNDVVPELFGTFKRYPDYLVPPCRRWQNMREQILQFVVCIGVGRYQINPADVKVGDTPLSELGDDASFTIYQPGASLATDPSNQHWHTVEEVGGTSSGTAGLELSTEAANRENWNEGTYNYNGSAVTRTLGQWPPAWGNGTAVRVEYPLSYVVTDELIPGTDPAEYISAIRGVFSHITNLTVGQSLYLGKINAGVSYTIRTVLNNGDGTHTVTIGTGPFGETPYRVLPGIYTYVFGSDIHRQIITFSETEMTLSNGTFPALSVGAPDWNIIFAGGNVYGEWSSEFVATPGNETSTEYEIDFFFPNGLGNVQSNGSVSNHTVSVDVQYRNKTGGVRTTVSRSYTAATLDQIGYTATISTSIISGAFRVRRTNALSASSSVRDMCNWFGLKSRLASRDTYPRWTTMSIRLRSGGRLAAQSENQINVVATRILSTLQASGAWGAAVPTRDISAAMHYITGTIGAQENNAELKRLHDIWAGRGDTFDYVFDLTTAKAAINGVLGAGMAELSVSDGLIKPVRDGVRTAYEQSYSPQNMTKPLRRTFRTPRHDDNDGVEVEYTDSQTWTQMTVVCKLPGSLGVKLEKIKLIGVTSRTRAWRIGMRAARRQRYQRWEYSFSTEMDALNSEYLSYVPLFDNIPGYGQSALLRAVSGTAGSAVTITVDEPLEWIPGASHVVGFRRPDGLMAGPYPAAQGGDDYTVVATIPAPLPTVTLKREPTHVYFGVAERFCFPALINNIKPQGMETVSVSAVNYDVRVYADDNNTPPA